MDASTGCTTGAPPSSDVRQVSLSMTTVSIDGGGGTAWMGLGYNLDGKCTTATSTDVCTQVQGSPKSEQIDGTGGIDNSFGENVCPILVALAGANSCSTVFTQTILVTDASGNGKVAFGTGNGWLVMSIDDAWVQMPSNGTPGMVGGVVPTQSLVDAMQALYGSFSMSLCNGQSFQSIAQQFEEASDILPDGTNVSGQTCGAVSIGFSFSGATTYTGTVPVQNNPCITDAGPG